MAFLGAYGLVPSWAELRDETAQRAPTTVRTFTVERKLQPPYREWPMDRKKNIVGSALI
jgi:hypothetical protein